MQRRGFIKVVGGSAVVWSFAATPSRPIRCGESACSCNLVRAIRSHTSRSRRFCKGTGLERRPRPADRYGSMFSQTSTIMAATREDKMRYLPLTRRTVLKTAALSSVDAITAPYVRGSYAAGKLTLGCWDHWVPSANNTLTKLCNEWGEKNKVEVRIDYITSQGEKDKLTAAAEAQAGTGHDIMSHRDWNIQVHQQVLEPVDD